jgi:hypothetical protein
MCIEVKPAVFKIDGTIFAASMDGISDNRKTAVEIKCPGEKSHSIALEGKVPDNYYPQLQHQMMVCDLSSIYYMSWTEYSHIILTVNRDDAFIEKMKAMELEFWQYVVNFEKPPRIKKAA